MPAVPRSPPAKMLLGENDAAKFHPSGPPSMRAAMPAISIDTISAIINTPRTFAPTSTRRIDNTVAITTASSDQTYQGKSMPNCAAI